MGNPLFPGTAASAAPQGLRGGSLILSSSKSGKSGLDYDPSTHPGIINLGNTCFLNSVLQAIGNTKDFQQLIQGQPQDEVDADSGPSRQQKWSDRLQSPALRISDQEHGRSVSHSSTQSSLSLSPSTTTNIDPVDTIKAETIPLPSIPSDDVYEPTVLDLPLNTAFRHVLEKVWDSSRKTRSTHVNPKKLLNLLGKKFDQYLEYGQQDGHELMRHLLDACRMEEVDMIKKLQPPKSSSNAAAPLPSNLHMSQADAASSRDDAQEEEDKQLVPFLDLIFCGKLASMVVCEGCHKVSHTYEDFYDLSLSLRDDAANYKGRKRDRLRSMADRWRRVTQPKGSGESAASAQDTPVGIPAFSENEGSDADSSYMRSRKSAGAPSSDEGRSRFQLRKKSIRKSAQSEFQVATSGSEMEPDFPDMASLSLAPVSSRVRADQHADQSGDTTDARTSMRESLKSNGLSASSVVNSRDPSPNAPSDPRGSSLHAMGPPSRPKRPASHQAAYIARILAADPTANAGLATMQSPSSPTSGGHSLPANAPGRPLHDLLRRSAVHKTFSSDFETNPNSLGAKRRRRIQEEQLSTGLIASLSQFTSVEVLDGENSFACKNCWRLANPPSPADRAELRRRRRRRGNRVADDDEEDPSESSGRDSDSNQLVRPINKAKTANGTKSLGSTTDSQSLSARSSIESGPVSSVSTSALQAGSVHLPAPLMSEGAGDENNEPGTRARADSEASLSASGDVGSRAGYETGTETDASVVTNSVDEPATSGPDSGPETEESLRQTAAGNKRSAQSLSRRALKRYLIASAPPVLIFHLKRFQSTGRGYVSGLAGFKKIDNQVTFPEYVDITPWLAPPREEYDHRGRLEATSDPLAIRKRAEEEARRAGMDARDVQVEVQTRHSKTRHGLRPPGKHQAGRKHAMWSWHVREPTATQSHAESADPSDLEEGPEVKLLGKSELIPSVLQRPKTEYRLYAVIVHQGSLSAGHYTAYILSDRIKLKDTKRDLIARSAPTSRSATPAAPGTSLANSTQLGRRDSLNFSQYFLGGSKESKDKAARGVVSPTPAAPQSIPISAFAPARPSSARPASTAPAPMSVSNTLSTSSTSATSSTGSNNDAEPRTSVSSHEMDRSKTSSVSFSTGPKLVHPRPQVKRMMSWNSLDELDQPTGAATPTAQPTSRPTIDTSRLQTHSEQTNEDEIDKRKVDDGRRWVYTSDTIVRAATIDEVLKAKAYMLFYERV